MTWTERFGITLMLTGLTLPLWLSEVAQYV